MRKSKKHFRLYSCCVLVKGYSQAVIFDLQRGQLVYLNNKYTDVLQFLETNPVEKLAQYTDETSFKNVTLFINNLIENELGFYTEKPKLFPKLDLRWDSPCRITNGVFDFHSMPSSRHFNAIKQLLELGCRALQLRFFYPPTQNDINELLQSTLNSSLSSISIIKPYNNDDIDLKRISDIIDNNLRIVEFIVYRAPFNRALEYRKFPVTFIQDDLGTIKTCGIISKNLFNQNIHSFTESHHFNSCLNRKISIDAEGNIKNCPSMSQSYGNIKDTCLKDAIDHPDFKKYWNINKDQIAVCKDCEFRYVCTDCRAYVENPEDLYSKPLKCGYNPYTCEWEEWSANPLKQKAIDYYGMREVLPEFKIKPDYAPSGTAESIAT